MSLLLYEIPIELFLHELGEQHELVLRSVIHIAIPYFGYDL